MHDPKAEYGARLSARQTEVDRLERRDRLVANARAVVFFAGVAMAWAAWGRQALDGRWLLLPVLAFFALVIVHDRAWQRRRRVERAVAHFRRALDRLDGKWVGAGVAGDRFADPHHPFANDLDLFGRGSLYELLCTARTQPGEEALAAWLRGATRAASPTEIRARQAAVIELAPRLELREELAVLGADLRAEMERPESLAAWGVRPAALDANATLARIGVALLALAASAGLILWAMGGSPLPFTIAIVVELAVYRAAKDAIEKVTRSIDKARHDLELLAHVIARFESERLEAPALAALKARLSTEQLPASVAIAKLARLADLLAARQNQFFVPFAFVLMWSLQLAYAVEAWRKKHGRAVAEWLSAVGELEALVSLANYAYEHPADPMPTIADEGPRYHGEALAHPLLPKAVANDVKLGGDGPRLYLVSGSNMSGKSTLLRTVGINAVLALAGAPVRARSLTLSTVALGATLRIQDSLAEGASRFYAEITRLQQIVELAQQGTLLFLLDEILHGTNSHDRRIGGEAVVRALVEKGAIGLCTTHDLALAEMVAALGPRAVNVHFEDHLEDGKLVFDYTLRDGVVRKSNALALMRAVGLDV